MASWVACRTIVVTFLLLILVGVGLPVGAAGSSPTETAPVIVAGTSIPSGELTARAQAFARNQFLDLRTASAYVAREAIDERWAVRDARVIGLLPTDADVDAALARVAHGESMERITAYYGMTAAELRERVRGELAARVLADRALSATQSGRAYGRYFLARAARRRARTRCRSPFAPLDRCLHGRDHSDERSTPLGIAELRNRGRHTLAIDLAPLLGIETDPAGRGYRRASERLRRAISQTSRALARRVRLANDAYGVYVQGKTADEIAVARIAHRLVRGHPTPVLL